MKGWSGLWLLALVVIPVVFSACDRKDEPETGSIVAQVEWPETPEQPPSARNGTARTAANGTALATMPIAVVTVRATIDAADMDAVTKDFTASANSGVIDGIPAGTGRSLTLNGLNSANTVIFEGAASGITVTAGQATAPVTVVMEQTAEAAAAAPGPVTGFTATPGDGTVTLGWTNPGDAAFSGVRIMRLSGTVAPSSPIDGDLVYDGLNTNHVDSGLTNNTTYHYTAFAHNSVPFYSAGDSKSATPAAPGGQGNLWDVGLWDAAIWQP